MTDPIAEALDAFVPAFVSVNGDWHGVLQAAGHPAAVGPAHRQSPPARSAMQPRRLWPRITSSRRTAYLVIATLLAAGGAGAYAFLSQLSTTTATSRPLSGGTTVTTAAQADAVLPFSVVLPSNVTPVDMTAFPQSAAIADGPELIAHFNTPAYGLFDLTEHPTDWTVARLQEFATQWKGGPTHVQIVDGVHVVFGSGPAPSGAAPAGSAGEENFAIWIRGDGTSPVLTTIDGPWIEGQPFTPQQALAVAADIINQGG